MRKTLRDAHYIRSAIETHLKSVSPLGAMVTKEMAVDISWDPFTSAAEEKMSRIRSESSRKISETLNEQLKLSAILCDVRRSIGRANSIHSLDITLDGEEIRVSLDDVLALQAAVQRDIKLQQTLADIEPYDVEADMAKVNRLASSLKTRDYGYESSVTLVTVGDDIVAGAKDAIIGLKRRLRQLDDARITLNASLSIEIPDDDLAILSRMRIV